MVRNNSGGLGWKVKLTSSQIRNKIAVDIWVDKYEVDYALLDTKEEKINFLKEILEKNTQIVDTILVFYCLKIFLKNIIQIFY